MQTKQPLTRQMLEEKLDDHFRFGCSDSVAIFFGVLLIGSGIATLAAVVGLVFLFIGSWLLWGVISNTLKYKARKNKILHGNYYLSAQKVRQKEIREGDGDTVDTCWIYLDSPDAHPIEDDEYALTQEGDVYYLLYLDGETISSARYPHRLYEPDAQVQSIIR